VPSARPRSVAVPAVRSIAPRNSSLGLLHFQPSAPIGRNLQNTRSSSVAPKAVLTGRSKRDWRNGHPRKVSTASTRSPAPSAGQPMCPSLVTMAHQQQGRVLAAWPRRCKAAAAVAQPWATGRAHC